MMAGRGIALWPAKVKLLFHSPISAICRALIAKKGRNCRGQTYVFVHAPVQPLSATHPSSEFSPIESVLRGREDHTGLTVPISIESLGI